MISHLSPKERSLIEAVLAFANLRSIKSNREVEDLFAAAKILGGEFGQTPGARFKRIGDASSAYKDKIQPMLRRWLRNTIRSNAGRAETASEVKHLIPRDIRAAPVFSMGRLSYDFQLTCVEAGCALAVGLILDADRGLTSRLQQCTLSTCGRFNVDFDSRNRPHKYCSVTHRNLANYEQSPERMREWRRAIRLGRKRPLAEPGARHVQRY